MTALRGITRDGVRMMAYAACAVLTAGCQTSKRAEPAFVPNARFGLVTIAVAPAANFSGGRDFDPERFADLMAGELGYADGVTVVPVSRTLAQMTARGLGRIETTQQALELTQALGADAILVFAVTAYEPYEPPRIGLTAQLIGRSPRGQSGMDPVALSRQSSETGKERVAGGQGVLAQTQRVFDASHDSVIEDVRRFASIRDANASPYGWRRYVVSQEEFIRFCCHATVRELMQGPPTAVHDEGRRG